MKSQKGITLLKFVLIIIVLMMLAGVTTYVAFQDNGPIDRLEQNIVNNLDKEAESADNNTENEITSFE